MSEEEEAPAWVEQPALAPGLLTAVPLLLLYELALFLGAESLARNGAEELLTAALRPLGSLATVLRFGLILAAAVWAYLRWSRTEEEEGEEPRLGLLLARTMAEGVALAFVLGPLLLWMLEAASGHDLRGALQSPHREEAPVLLEALRLAGAAPFEELLFRVGVYGLVYLFARWIVEFLGGARTLAWLAADVLALVLSSIAFAGFHLEQVQAFLGRPGEPFEPDVFLWRLSAGLLLAGIFRWRGLGTASWAHAVFNLGLALGAGPGTFLAA